MMVATHSMTLLTRAARLHARSSGAHASPCAWNFGAIRYVCKKLTASNAPEIQNTHSLWRESVTSQGITESMEATEAPKPSSTSSDGSAQQSSVLTDVNSDK